MQQPLPSSHLWRTCDSALPSGRRAGGWAGRRIQLKVFVFLRMRQEGVLVELFFGQRGLLYLGGVWGGGGGRERRGGVAEGADAAGVSGVRDGSRRYLDSDGHGPVDAEGVVDWDLRVVGVVGGVVVHVGDVVGGWRGAVVARRRRRRRRGVVAGGGGALVSLVVVVVVVGVVVGLLLLLRCLWLVHCSYEGRFCMAANY